VKTFKFSIEEVCYGPEEFLVPFEYQEYYCVMEEAAKIFYYARQGFEESWPLTFVIYSEEDVRLGRSYIFLLSALPHFDVIPDGEDSL
jgi:hypothetical protein